MHLPNTMTPFMLTKRRIAPLFANPLQLMFGAVVILSACVLLTGPYFYFAFLPGMALLFLLLLWKCPQFGYFLIIFLVSFMQYSALSETYSFLSLPKVIGLLTIGVVFFHFMSSKSQQPYPIQSNLWPLFGAYFLVSVLSALQSEYPAASLDTIRKLITGYSFFLLTVMFISREQFRRILPLVLVISIFLSASLSVIGFAFVIPTISINPMADNSRLAGGAGDPNEFAVMLIFSLPLLFHMFTTSKKLLNAFMLAFLSGVCLVAVILTYSRAGAIILAATLFFLFLQHFHRIKVRALGFIILFLCVVVFLPAAIIPGEYWQRQKSVTDYKTDASIGRRASYLIVGYEAFKENPILGSGPGVFREIFALSGWARHFQAEGESLKRPAHNSYVEVLVGTGTLGFGIYAVIIWTAFHNFYRARRAYKQAGDHEMEQLTTAYGISFAVMLLGSLFLSLDFHKYFWLSLGLSYVSVRLSRKGEPVGSKGSLSIGKGTSIMGKR